MALTGKRWDVRIIAFPRKLKSTFPRIPISSGNLAMRHCYPQCRSRNDGITRGEFDDMLLKICSDLELVHGWRLPGDGSQH
jgi:hypothetical protein